jgi:hypothetical protein
MLLVETAAFAQTHRSRSTASRDPDQPAIHDYVLTMDKVNKYSDVMNKMQAAAEKDPALKSEMDKVGDTNVSNVDKIRLIENSPHVSRFLQQNSETPRDVVLLPMTLITAGFAIAAEQQGGKQPDFVNPANIQFVKQHQADLQKLHIIDANDKQSPADKDNDQ